ncbi:putative 4 histone acetyltransferase [Blastocystis sp. subtype 4]|uniref:putative 4 histone acetyltransferase n=1 Tax=Blastocystis sp. subtype 4 TaxID=944170 RepID=UPI0007112E3C|nr:putative 4 histone acetyltransferase [Blastocystis sp. subtype 4]KNB44167.1 putative 4 histone acetyltransferase [Blastocystis sp. subtype 4]|eukprot:XP_014527610.1 putative 4 histone acetyltransferase [Blastocystis sp. subtype 4]
MSTLISYAKSFNLPTAQEMSHMEIANLVANHFLAHTIDENKVIHEFYDKIEAIKNNPTTSYLDSSSVSTKRQTKRPKKYTQNEDTIYHYNTRSKTAEASAPVEKEPEQVIQYCICGQPENDNMVECENTECKHKWFHYSCVGITDPDSLPAKWYCPDCAASHTD